MKIETKFSIGDLAWTLVDFKITEVRVFGLEVEICENEDGIVQRTERYGISKNGPKTTLGELLRINEICGWSKCSQLFNTKQQLIDSL